MVLHDEGSCTPQVRVQIYSKNSQIGQIVYARAEFKEPLMWVTQRNTRELTQSDMKSTWTMTNISTLLAIE